LRNRILKTLIGRGTDLDYARDGHNFQNLVHRNCRKSQTAFFKKPRNAAGLSDMRCDALVSKQRCLEWLNRTRNQVGQVS
jgi:hypothetical protein